MARPYTDFSVGENIASLVLLIVVAAFGGIAVGLLGGFHFPKVWKFPGYHLKPIIKGVVLPPLIIMIIMGAIARNCFGSVMEAYPSDWTAHIRGFCLAILLIRGGLQVSFRGKGLPVLLLSVVPQFFEATIVALIAHELFGMPINVGYVLGYNLACISPSILVPGVMNLHDKGYGRSKNIAGILIAAGTFDDISCIICFGICKSIALNFAGFSGDESLGWAIGKVFVENAISLVVGVCFGLGAWPFKFIKNNRIRINLKLVYCILGAMIFVIIANASHAHDAKYIGALSFGYTCFRFWGTDKPAKEIAWFWFFLQPLLFGTVGGQLLFS
jgi:NhaP-type Na+/H+ or K+/H+ antiporter